MGLPFGLDGSKAAGLGLLADVVGHCGDMAGVAPRRDDHVIRDGCLAYEIDRDHVLGLIVVQEFLDQRLQLFRRRRGPRLGRSGGGSFRDYGINLALSGFRSASPCLTDRRR